ncbi:MAG: right-handed parallel beta-helix repeat-containing protein, partial [Pseudomonadales bacterium]
SGPLPQFEVFANGERLQIARWPNTNRDAPGGNTWAHIATAPLNSLDRFSHSALPKLSSKSLDEAVIHIWPASDWFDQYVGIRSISSGNIRLADRVSYPIEAGRRFAIINAKELLDAPGEWHYSPAKTELRIIPIAGSALRQPVVSYLDNVISMRYAQNVHLKDLTIEFSRKTAATIFQGHGNIIANCIVRNAGGFGIHVNHGAEHSVIDSEIYGTGYGGVFLRGGDRKTLKAANHTAVYNNIHDTGTLLHGTMAALNLQGVGNTARENHIHHTPSMAVWIKGNDHLIEHNDIHNACEQNGDCGAVYTGRDWTFHGNLIRYNRIHDIYGYGMKSIDAETGVPEYVTPYDTRGVYLDDAVGGISVIGNLFYRIPDRMLQIGGGRNHLIDNNVFVTNSYAIWMDARWPDFPWETTMMSRLNAVPYKSALWRSRYPRLAKPMNNIRWPEDNRITRNIIIAEPSAPGMLVTFRYKIPPANLEIDNNIVWNHGDTVMLDFHLLKGKTVGLRDWATWQEMTGHDKHSLLVDPLFVDAANGNFGLRANSPAHKLGIKEIPIKDSLKSYKQLQKSSKTSPSAPNAASGVQVD